MSLINQIKGIFVSKVPNPEFVIYTNQILDPDPQTATDASARAIRFNQLYDIAANESVKIAFEPLENSDFTSDSLQQNPNTYFLTGVASPYMQSADYSNQDYRNDINKVVKQIQKYKMDKTLLTIINTKPLFQNITNVHITGFKYDQSPTHQHLIAYLQLQEVRIVTTTQYGTLQQKQVSNPANTSTVQTGQVAPQDPTAPQTTNLEPSPFQ